MNKTKLRDKLTTAVNQARDLKNTGLDPRSNWTRTDLKTVADNLRWAANAIDEYLESDAW